MRRSALVILGLGLFVLSGCGASSGTGTTVNGVFETIGGAPGYGPHRLPGTVVFTNGQGSHTSVKVAANGAFSVPLAPGTYAAVGYSPEVHSDGREMACYSIKPVVVHGGKSVSATVACQIM